MKSYFVSDVIMQNTHIIHVYTLLFIILIIIDVIIFSAKFLRKTLKMLRKWLFSNRYNSDFI